MDEERGLLYAGIGTPSNDYYGGHRLGDNLYAESLVALDARTGERVWHFQTVHHGLWDFDLPGAPVLLTVTVGGRAVDAVAVAGKTGFVYTFDRETGRAGVAHRGAPGSGERRTRGGRRPRRSPSPPPHPPSPARDLAATTSSTSPPSCGGARRN